MIPARRGDREAEGLMKYSLPGTIRASMTRDRLEERTSRGYSWRSDSIGSSLEARKAGIIPLTRPTALRITVEAISVAG